jgi:hypothetical protein
MKRIGQKRKKPPQEYTQPRLPLTLTAEEQVTDVSTVDLEIKGRDSHTICKGEALTVVIIHKITKGNRSPIEQHASGIWETIAINLAIALLMFILSLLVK